MLYQMLEIIDPQPTYARLKINVQAIASAYLMAHHYGLEEQKRPLDDVLDSFNGADPAKRSQMMRYVADVLNQVQFAHAPLLRARARENKKIK